MGSRPSSPIIFARCQVHRPRRPHDIPGEYVAVSGLPKRPAGAAIRRIDVIIRVGRPAPAAD
jgi:hypothetical protein